MKEVNQLIYNAIRSDTDYKSITGATSKDPRIYKERIPVKITIDSNKPSYAVYHFTGAGKPPDFIHGAQRNDLTYTLECYALDDVTLIVSALESIFRDKEFETASFRVGYTYAVEGSWGFNDALQLYTQTLTVYFTKIFALP